jgi:uncharacterized protein YodC (DUF2158 family)
MRIKIRVGDVVRLKSGGPDMAVTCVTTDTGMVRCRWMANDGSDRRLEFPARCLTRWRCRYSGSRARLPEIRRFGLRP